MKNWQAFFHNTEEQSIQFKKKLPEIMEKYQILFV